MSPSPLYYKFRTETRFYVYDAYSSHILCVSSPMWESLDSLLGTRGHGPDVQTGKTPALDRQRCVDELMEARCQGYLLDVNVDRMTFAEDQERLLKLLDVAIPQLTLEVTERCTSSCRYCAYAHSRRRASSPRDMNLPTATAAVRYFLAHSGQAADRSISFWGGEPLLGFPLIEHVCGCLAERPSGPPVRYSMTTNAAVVTPEIAEWLREKDVQLLVSLDGPAEIHNRHRVTRAGTGTFAETMGGLRVLAATCPDYYAARVWFNCVIAPRSDLRLIREFFASNPLVANHTVQLSLISGRGTTFYRDYGDYSEEQLREIDDWLIEAVVTPGDPTAQPFADTARQRLGRIACRRRTPPDGCIQPNGCCVPLMKKFHVAVDGRIYLCERVDHGRPLGDVMNGGTDLARVRSLMAEYCTRSLPDCRACCALRLCARCFRDSLSEGVWETQNRQRQCRRMRETLAGQLRMYATILERRPDAFASVFVRAS